MAAKGHLNQRKEQLKVQCYVLPGAGAAPQGGKGATAPLKVSKKN